MTTSIENRPSNADVSELIVRLIQTSRPREVEAIADQLGLSGDRRAIRPLLERLGDCHVQEDADIEDAVCGALVSLDVMCNRGNRSFFFRPRRLLADDVVDTIRDLGSAIPWRYFDTRHV